MTDHEVLPPDLGSDDEVEVPLDLLQITPLFIVRAETRIRSHRHQPAQWLHPHAPHTQRNTLTSAEAAVLIGVWGNIGKALH